MITYENGGEMMLEKLIQYALLNCPHAVSWIKRHAWWLCSMGCGAAMELIARMFG